MAVSNGLLPERYANVREIGRGGMGEIYRATDTSLGRAVAIKVLDERYAQDSSVRQRFTREALAVARLSGNPNIVTIYDVGEQSDRPFIVMEYLAGGSLEQKTREGAQPPSQVLEWLEQAASALDAAHRNGVVHRDVKPANLLFDVHGRVHVADFGIASAAGMQSLTQTGTVLGTASYLSPEQATGDATSAASDLYSLGVVAFELLTGHRPFEGDTIAEEAAAHVSGDVPSVQSFDRRLPHELDPVFARALSKEPTWRFGSGAEFVAALRAAFDGAAGATAIVPPRRAPARRGPSPKLLVLAAALILAGIAGAAAAALVSGGSSPKALPPARPSVSIRTVTETTPASTVVTTATAPTTSTTPSSSDPVALNDQAYQLMQQHDYSAALPLLQQAVQELQGQSSTITGYANYNLGVTLIALGQCDTAMQYLDVARHIEPGRHEVHDAMKVARNCSGGNGNSD